jgi:hypothetical protein
LDPEDPGSLRVPPGPLANMPANLATICVIQEPSYEEKVATMRALAMELGFVVTPIDRWRAELALSMASRLKAREGVDVYQSAAYSIAGFPRDAALSILPEASLQNVDSISSLTEASSLTWKLTTVAEATMTLGPILAEAKAHWTAGLTRALKTPSELVSRVVASMLPPIEISHVMMPRGVDRLYLNFNYILTGEDGIIYPPKDGDRIEIALEPLLEHSMRQRVLQDVAVMADAGYSMSPGWLRQMGRETEAQMVEAQIANTEGQNAAVAAAAAALPPGSRAPKQKRALSDEWMAERIVEQRKMRGQQMYLVEWQGYQPGWEVYRATGQPGIDPVTTWEPWDNVRGMLLREWRVAQRAAAQAAAQ